MVVKWENNAIQDLKEFKSISQLSNVNNYILDIVNYVNTLSEYPKLGKIYLYIQGKIIRQLIYKEHKIFYYLDDEIIHVLTVIHHRQDTQTKINFVKKYFNNQ